MKHIVRKGGLRIGLIVLILVLANVLYTRFVWHKDLEEDDSLLSELHDFENGSQVLYFAESSNFNIHQDDSLKLRISDFIDRYTPNLYVGTVDHAGYHVGQYLPVIQRIKPSSAVETVIVTMNLRTFGQDAIYGPNEASLQKSARLTMPAPPLANRFLASLNFYDNRSAHERDLLKWESWMHDTLKSDNDSIQFPYKTIRSWCDVVKFPDSNGVENMHYRILADQNIKVYGFHLDDQNPMVQWFDEIVEVGKKKDLNLVFNILAENVEQADSLVGENLVWLMKKNRDFLVDRYRSRGVIVVDNLEKVGNEHFIDRKVFPTEHYDQIGRETIAQHVADSVNALYSRLSD